MDSSSKDVLSAVKSLSENDWFFGVVGFAAVPSPGFVFLLTFDPSFLINANVVTVLFVTLAISTPPLASTLIVVAIALSLEVREEGQKDQKVDVRATLFMSFLITPLIFYAMWVLAFITQLSLRGFLNLYIGVWFVCAAGFLINAAWEARGSRHR